MWFLFAGCAVEVVAAGGVRNGSDSSTRAAECEGLESVDSG